MPGRGVLSASTFESINTLRMARPITSFAPGASMYFETTAWVPGTKVHFGTFRFIVTRDGGVEWTQPEVSLPPSPIPNFLPIAPLGLYPVLGAIEPCDGIDALLNALPSQEDLDAAMFTVTDVATQPAEGDALIPNNRPEDSSFFPFELLSTARSFERLTLDFLTPPEDKFVGR